MIPILASGGWLLVPLPAERLTYDGYMGWAKEADSALHRQADRRLTALGQRYTSGRQALVEALASAGRPLTSAESLRVAGGGSLSSTYRNLTVLSEAGIVRKLMGPDDMGRFELAEELSSHHHHLVCSACGVMVDVEASEQLERAVEHASQQAAEASGFAIESHRLDFEGLCRTCLSAEPGNARG